jgi:hypothetical protein
MYIDPDKFKITDKIVLAIIILCLAFMVINKR